MPLLDILKKRDKIKEGSLDHSGTATGESSDGPFTFLRTTTSTQEVIYPPSFPGDKAPTGQKKATAKSKSTPTVKETEKSFEKENHLAPSPKKRPGLHFRASSRSSVHSNASSAGGSPDRSEKRLSSRLEKLHIGRHSRASSAGSTHVPDHLPEISNSSVGAAQTEVEWERRAALLAKQNEKSIGNPPISINNGSNDRGIQSGGHHEEAATKYEVDGNIQEAIRLHEAGDLERSTAMFGKLADPNGPNDALSQILYGMALQHGWGIESSPSLALHYKTLAASNSAAVESHALSAGSARGGTAKGELVLAIYELANTFRHGWGCEKDPMAARKYYETAAELGDVDAMVEAAWCYENGFGGAKDKLKAATYLRRAEEKGRIEVGNSWIYKDKYGGPKKPK